MKKRFRIFKRKSGVFYLFDDERNRQESLKTKDKAVAQRITHAKNESAREPKLVVFGHDHNTSREKKIWNHKLASGTTCINVGQDSRLRYTLIEMTYPSEKPNLPTEIVVQAQVGGVESLIVGGTSNSWSS